MFHKLNNLLERFFNQPIIDIQKQEGGVVNQVYSFKSGDKEFIIKIMTRRPNDDYERLRFAKAKEIIQRVRKETQVPAPKIFYLETEKNELGISFLIMEKIEGKIIEQVWDQLASNEKRGILNQFGTIVGEIHSLKNDHYGELNRTGLEKSFSSWKEYLHNEITQAIKVLEKDKTISEEVLMKAKIFVDENIDILPNCPPQLIHSDLNFANIFILKENNQWIIQGVIDWEWCFSACSNYEFYDIEYNLRELEQKENEDKHLLDYFLETYPTQFIPQPEKWAIERKIYLIAKELSSVAFGYIHHNPFPDLIKWVENEITRAIKDN